MVKLIFDGCIGAGKTSLIGALDELYRSRGKTVSIIKEQVDKWIETGAFQEFNNNVPEKAYSFQNIVVATQISTSCSVKKADITLCERDVESTSGIFAKMLGKFFTPEQKNMFPELTKLKRLIPVEPSLRIYVRPSVDTCMKRLQRRGRVGESKITEQYQSDLQKAHDAFYSTVDKKLIIDFEADYHDPSVISKIAKQIEEMLNVSL